MKFPTYLFINTGEGSGDVLINTAVASCWLKKRKQTHVSLHFLTFFLTGQRKDGEFVQRLGGGAADMSAELGLSWFTAGSVK